MRDSFTEDFMYFVDAKSILSSQNGMNIYRGCTHGCIYCDSRSKCYHTPEPFENVEVKQNAPQLLDLALSRKRKKCMIGTGSMSDPYMHCEKELKLTQKCLEVIDDYGFGATVITKSDLVLRDLEIFKSINKKAKSVLQMTLTTFDDELCKKIEPCVCPTSRRVEVLKKFRREEIPTVVWLSPFLPGINNTQKNLEGLLYYCLDAGVCGIINFGIGLTLREGNREYFYDQLEKKFGGMKKRYCDYFGNSYFCGSSNNDKLMDFFYGFCAKHNIISSPENCFEYLREFPEEKLKSNVDQAELF